MNNEWEDEEKYEQMDSNLYFQQLYKKVSNLNNAHTYYEFFYNILSNIVEFELGVETATAKINKETAGSFIEFEKEGWMENAIKKFSELMFIDGLIRLTGNIDKRDEILDNFITNQMFVKQDYTRRELKKMIESLVPGGMEK